MLIELYYFRVLLFFFFLMIRRPPRSTLSLHDALPISRRFPSVTPPETEPTPLVDTQRRLSIHRRTQPEIVPSRKAALAPRSEEHTSELQSHLNLVCRLLLEKKKQR